MRESMIYQDILEEGRKEGQAEGRRASILKFYSKRFGKPSEDDRVALEAITDLKRLDRMTERHDEVSSWRDLLQIA